MYQKLDFWYRNLVLFVRRRDLNMLGFRVFVKIENKIEIFYCEDAMEGIGKNVACGGDELQCSGSLGEASKLGCLDSDSDCLGEAVELDCLG